jgi:hypothetical protein
MTNLDEIKLEPLMGKTKETKIMDLIIPLKEGTVFTNKEVIKALGSTERQINPLLDGLVKNGLLIQSGRETGKYIVNTKSNRAWAIKNLLVAIYSDMAHANSLKRMGREQ